MKKILKWFAIIVIALIVFIAAAAVALPFILPLERIKNFAAEKMSETLDREVKLGKISFNIFKGFVLEDLYIGNREGFSKKPFVSAGAIELRYDLFSIFRGQFNIGKIALVRPAILIEKDKSGEFNFSDLTAKKPKKDPSPEKVPKKKKETQFDFMVSSFSISDGELIFLDRSGDEVKESGFKRLNLNVAGITMAPLSPISLSLNADAIYQGQPIPAGLKGTIAADISKQTLQIKGLTANAAGDSVLIKGKVLDYGSKSPDITLSLSSNRIKIDNFLNIFGGSKKPPVKKEKPPYGTLTKSIDRSTGNLSPGLKFKGDINFSNIQFRDLSLEKLALKAALKDKVVDINFDGTSAYRGVLSGSARINLNTSGLSYSLSKVALKDMDATPASNGFINSFLSEMEDSSDLIDKIEGKLSISLDAVGRGVEVPDIIKNIKGSGVFSLMNGKVKKLKSLEGVADKINLPMLKKDMELEEFKCVFSAAGGIFAISELSAHNGDKGDVKLGFKGSANIEKMAFVSGNRLTIWTSPSITPKELELFKDKSGWGVFEFELTGSLKKPIPIPKFDKPVDKAKEQLQKEIDKKRREEEERLRKEEERLRIEAEKKAKELEDKLKKEAEDKLKDLLKF